MGLSYTPPFCTLLSPTPCQQNRLSAPCHRLKLCCNCNSIQYLIRFAPVLIQPTSPTAKSSAKNCDIKSPPKCENVIMFPLAILDRCKVHTLVGCNPCFSINSLLQISLIKHLVVREKPQVAKFCNFTFPNQVLCVNC